MTFRQVVIMVFISLYFWAATLEIRIRELEKRMAFLEELIAAAEKQ